MLYCHLWPVWLYNIFPPYLINGTIFGKILMNTKCVLTFSTNFIWNVSHFTNNSERCCHKCAHLFMLSNRYSCQTLIKLKFSPTDFSEKVQISSFIKFHRVVRCGQTDMTNLIVAFRNFAKARIIPVPLNTQRLLQKDRKLLRKSSPLISKILRNTDFTSRNVEVLNFIAGGKYSYSHKMAAWHKIWLLHRA
jgi:hypothetical protein